MRVVLLLIAGLRLGLALLGLVLASILVLRLLSWVALLGALALLAAILALGTEGFPTPLVDRAGFPDILDLLDELFFSIFEIDFSAFELRLKLLDLFRSF